MTVPRSEHPSLRDRLRSDLLTAMKSRDSVTVAALRNLLAALGNAEAVESPPDRQPTVGEPGDLPRRELTDLDDQRILESQMAELRGAVSELRAMDREDAAATLIAHLAVLDGYRTRS